MEQELTKEIATKVRDVVSKGLSKGLGVQEEGKMCIEAAVCYAYGLPHSDNPPCVGSAVRSFKIRLNDALWSSNEARGKGMLALSIAQLNSNQINQLEFSKKVVLKTINIIISQLAINLKQQELGDKLAIVVDLIEARRLCQELKKFATAAAAYVAYSAADAADAAAAAAAYAADAAYSAAYVAYSAADAAAAYVAYSAADAADAAADKRNEILIQSANICLEVLKEMKSPGCEYLYLIEETN